MNTFAHTMYEEIFSCREKVAVVVGGFGLLGREIARALGEFGALVYVADLRAGERERGPREIPLDITDEDQVKEAFSRVIREAGGIDILVNSAYPRTADWGTELEQVPFSSWRKNVDDHLGGCFLCCREAAERMKSQRGGTIINIASIYGVTAPDFRIYKGTGKTMPVAYSAIKGGIIALTRHLATYYAPHGVRANAVSPGGMAGNEDRSFVDAYSERTPLGRMGDPRDVVGAVVYLASAASAYVTGQNLLVDGGWTAW